MEVVQPGTQPKLLMTLARRATTLAAQGVDLVIVLPFDDALRHLSPEAFVDHVLVEPLQAHRVVVGADFRFGHRAAGSVVTLDELGAAAGFSAEGVTLLELDGVVISSTAIRSALDAGDVALATRMLGRPPLVDGVIVRGDQRGAGLGYPTANLQTGRRVAVPAKGIYAGALELPDGVAHPCVTSVGVNPTFGGQELRIEAHLLDFSGDLYGLRAGLDFRHRLRDEIRFDSVAELVAQMDADTADARRLLGLPAREGG
jgi:riboflavin kinase/FMN adenylyltransferase